MSSVHVGVAWWTSSTCALAFSMEVVRVYQEITRLQDRYNSFARGEIDLYDQRWTSGCLFIPGTDAPLHPAAVAFTPAWRLSTCILLFLLWICEIPQWRGPTYYVGWGCILFDRDTSVWYVGLIQAYIGMGMLGTIVVFPDGPPNVNQDAVTWARYVSAWFLFFTGMINVLFGCLFGPRVRWLRGQAPLRIRPPLVGRMSPGAHRVRGIWPFLRGHIMALNAGRPGPVMQMLADMDMAVTGM